VKLDQLPPVGSRWQIPDYPGTVYEVLYPILRNGAAWARMLTVQAGHDAELGHEFEVELAWFEYRKATEVKL
jgi:hypothetical protein